MSWRDGLTAEQMVWLSAYRSAALEANPDRDWRLRLAHDWSVAGTKLYALDWAPLQQLRNNRGGAWLKTVPRDF